MVLSALKQAVQTSLGTRAMREPLFETQIDLYPFLCCSWKHRVHVSRMPYAHIASDRQASSHFFGKWCEIAWQLQLIDMLGNNLVT